MKSSEACVSEVARYTSLALAVVVSTAYVGEASRLLDAAIQLRRMPAAGCHRVTHGNPSQKPHRNCRRKAVGFTRCPVLQVHVSWLWKSPNALTKVAAAAALSSPIYVGVLTAGTDSRGCAPASRRPGNAPCLEISNCPSADMPFRKL